MKKEIEEFLIQIHKIEGIQTDTRVGCIMMLGELAVLKRELRGFIEK